jgi:hypothetical protein
VELAWKNWYMAWEGISVNVSKAAEGSDYDDPDDLERHVSEGAA